MNLSSLLPCAKVPARGGQQHRAAAAGHGGRADATDQSQFFQHIVLLARAPCEPSRWQTPCAEEYIEADQPARNIRVNFG